MVPDTGILTTILAAFLATFKAGFGPVKIDAMSLLSVLAAIELTVALLFWVLRGEDALTGLIQKILLIGMFVFFVGQWPSLVGIVVRGFEQTGTRAAGVPASPVSALMDPSAIIDYGFKVTQPIQAEIDSLSSGALGTLQNLGLISMLGWAEIGILSAFFIIAIQAFVTYLEFYLVAVLALILVPFGVFRHTTFLAEKAFGVVVAHGVKLMVLAFIMGAAMPVLSMLALPPEPTIRTAWCMLLASGAVMFLAWHAPGIAGGMMAGGPSLSAGSAAGTAIAAGAGVLGAGAGGALAASRATMGATAAVHAARMLQTSAQPGALGGALAGAGLPVVAPARSLGDRMSDALRQGRLRGYDASRGTTFADAAQGTADPARRVPDEPHLAGTAKWMQSAVPPESRPHGGISVPIRHDNEGSST